MLISFMFMVPLHDAQKANCGALTQQISAPERLN